MATETIEIVSAAEAQKIAMNKRSKKHKTITVQPGQSLADVMLFLGAGVKKADYPGIAGKIKAITGIDDIKLVIDGKFPATVPDGEEYQVSVDVHFRQETIPVEP